MPLHVLDAMARHGTPEGFVRQILLPALKNGQLPRRRQLDTPPAWNLPPSHSIDSIALVNAGNRGESIRVRMDLTHFQDPRLVARRGEVSLPKLRVGRAYATIPAESWRQACDQLPIAIKHHAGAGGARVPSDSERLVFPSALVSHWPADRRHRTATMAAVKVGEQEYSELAWVASHLAFFNDYLSVTTVDGKNSFPTHPEPDDVAVRRLVAAHPEAAAIMSDLGRLADVVMDAHMRQARKAAKPNVLAPKVRKLLKNYEIGSWKASKRYVDSLAQILSSYRGCYRVRLMASLARQVQ